MVYFFLQAVLCTGSMIASCSPCACFQTNIKSNPTARQRGNVHLSHSLTGSLFQRLAAETWCVQAANFDKSTNHTNGSKRKTPFKGISIRSPGGIQGSIVMQLVSLFPSSNAVQSQRGFFFQRAWVFSYFLMLVDFLKLLVALCCWWTVDLSRVYPALRPNDRWR